jgi:hypothetical protein
MQWSVRLAVAAAVIALAGSACGEEQTNIVTQGRTKDEQDAARMIAAEHKSGNDGTQEPPSRVDCKRSGTSDFPTPVGETPKGVFTCTAKFPDGFTFDCEVDAGRDEAGCVPHLPGKGSDG